MFGHFKKSASVLTHQDTQMVDNDQWLATICNTAKVKACLLAKIKKMFEKDTPCQTNAHPIPQLQQLPLKTKY